MLLAIDSATQILSIALHDGRALRAEWSLDAGRQHSALLAPMIQQLMRQAKTDREDLQALAVAVGPGSFTGVRIGVALAKGMAAVADLPLVPLTTLEIVLEAHAPSRYQWPLIATAPAGRSRVIWAKYAPAGDAWVLRRPAEISTWESLLAACKPPVTISGEISRAGRQAIETAQQAGAHIDLPPATDRLRRAGHLAEIAWRRLRESQAARPYPAADVRPVYLKSPG
ncbi:MAG: tRNA (adenosine(37)-N6)-threonylcarbamoyltransferase complex dimerization subunit type 1 TsaB [Chloroflexi bacterium]|nr:tRNA (adenosine(37)-N6)-threonylcarbamoyltransferase complex dimerization subunit type 1 TsaB [Chloroflexota bacterium]